MSDIKVVKLLGVTTTLDITGEASVAAALDDELLIADTSDSGAAKKVTVQSVADLATPAALASSDITGQTLVTAAVGDHVVIADASDTDNLKKVTVQTIIDLAASGETNTASNVGAGTGIYKQKTGVDIELKSLTAGTGIALTSNTSDVGVALTNSRSPAGTGWIVGWTDWTSNRVISSTQQVYAFTPFVIDLTHSGTGGTNYHRNSTTDTSTFGQHEFLMGSSTSAFGTLRTDLEAMNLGSGTWRVGNRVMIANVPVSGADDYYWYCGFNSHANILNTSNYAVIGISLADNATNFVVQTHGGSGETVTDTGVAFASGTWFNLEIELTPTTVSAWIDGTIVLNASTSNVPTSATSFGAYPFVYSRVGASNTATRSFYLDYSYVAYKPGSARGSLGSGGPWG